MKNLKHALTLLAFLTILQACKKELNQGAKIKGKIVSIGLNNDTTYLANKSVFLVSETKKEFTLKRKSGKKGGFKFKNVPPGEYKLIYYVNKDMNQKGSRIIKTITILKEQKLLKLDAIIIKNSYAENEGSI